MYDVLCIKNTDMHAINARNADDTFNARSCFVGYVASHHAANNVYPQRVLQSPALFALTQLRKQRDTIYRGSVDLDLLRMNYWTLPIPCHNLHTHTHTHTHTLSLSLTHTHTYTHTHTHTHHRILE